MLTREFFLQDSLSLAEQLLGKLLVRRTKDGTTAGMIVETEAYAGPEDRGAHSYGGRRSPRTEIMFGEGGHAYVYMIYGMYHCFNVVAAPEGKPEAVLIRALEPVEGIGLMLRRQEERKKRSEGDGPNRLSGASVLKREMAGGTAVHAEGENEDRKRTDMLCSGPGKLCVSMGITGADYGRDLLEAPGKEEGLWGVPGEEENLREAPEGRGAGIPEAGQLFICGHKTIDPSRIYVSPRINIDYAEGYRDKPWRYYIYGDPAVSKVPKRYRGFPLYG